MTQAYSEAFVDQIQALANAQIDKYTAAIDQINAKIAALQAQEMPSTSANATRPTPRSTLAHRSCPAP